MYLLQYPLGLKALGHDVLWLETYRKCGLEPRDNYLIQAFLNRMREYGLESNITLLVFERDEKIVDLDTAEVIGKSRSDLQQLVSGADLLWNFANALQPPLLFRFKRRALVDGDPGHLQVCALETEMGQSRHDFFLTAGCKLHDSDCEVPTLGKTWHSFPQFVYLPMWPVAPDPGPQAPFTSVTQWNAGEVWWGERVLSVGKRDAYLQIAQLPWRAKRPFELAANMDQSDMQTDGVLLESNGWRIVSAHTAAATPAAYQEYIARSRAEISCPKPIYRELRTGWFSDRSACYMATGRPVLAEDTGFGDHFPTGKGLLVFRDLECAIERVKRIDADYPMHSRAAREFAEQYLDSARCLTAMLDACK